MNELISLGGLVGGAAICLYAIKKPPIEKTDKEAITVSPIAMLENEKKSAQKAKNKLPVIPGKNVIGLETASKLWKDEVTLCDAADLWREPEETVEVVSRVPRPRFENDEIEEFFVEFVINKPMVKGARRNIIIHLLKMLDAEGNCPSVVRGGDTEPENSMPLKTFDYLAKISLRKHSLDVARLFAKKTNNNSILADILIIALGHDIGKITRHHKALYTSADHPQISSSLLNGITEFMTLPNKGDISRAIIGHHLLKTNDTMTAMLMQVDAESRQQDFSRLYNEHACIAPNQENKTDETPTATTQTVSANQLSFKKKNTTNALGATNEAPTAFAKKEDDSKYRTKVVELPEWFNSKKLLDKVEPHINKLVPLDNNKNTWIAASCNGVVYLREDAVWDFLEEAGGGEDPVFMAASFAENSRRDFIRSAVETMGKEGFVVMEYIPQGGYATFATVVNSQGRANKILVIPIHVQSFSKLNSDFEALKEPKFARFVSKITPNVEGVGVATIN